jgi:hypothetical protein
MLQLPADLGFLHKPPDHLGVIAEVFAQDLQGNIAAEVGISTPEHGTHAAAGDLAIDSVPQGGLSIGHTTGTNQRRLETAVGVAEQDPRNRPSRPANCVQYALAGGSQALAPEPGP